jgi:hypothetical protein
MIEQQGDAKPSSVDDLVITWASWSPQLRSVLRIVAAFLFIQQAR